MQRKHLLLVTLLVLVAATTVLGSKSMLRRLYGGGYSGSGQGGYRPWVKDVDSYGPSSNDSPFYQRPSYWTNYH